MHIRSDLVLPHLSELVLGRDEADLDEQTEAGDDGLLTGSCLTWANLSLSVMKPMSRSRLVMTASRPHPALPQRPCPVLPRRPCPALPRRTCPAILGQIFVLVSDEADEQADAGDDDLPTATCLTSATMSCLTTATVSYLALGNLAIISDEAD